MSELAGSGIDLVGAVAFPPLELPLPLQDQPHHHRVLCRSHLNDECFRMVRAVPVDLLDDDRGLPTRFPTPRGGWFEQDAEVEQPAGRSRGLALLAIRPGERDPHATLWWISSFERSAEFLGSVSGLPSLLTNGDS